MNKELSLRLITSFCLFILLFLMYEYNYILVISLILIGVIIFFEFNNLIKKILKKNKNNFFILILYKLFFLTYISFLIYLILMSRINEEIDELLIIYPLLVSITSDIGGLIFGKIFKGKKLIKKISPNKTISGSIGSLFFSILLGLYLLDHFDNIPIIFFLLITFSISIISQLGDLLISYMKRKAKIKDTGNILPGHGGFLDRVDGIIFSIPIGFLLLNIFNS